MKSQPDRETMPGKNAEGGDHHPCRAFVREPPREKDGKRAFGGVQQKRQDPRERPSHARDVGCADVAAACLANVRRAKKFAQQQPEWNRAKEIRGHGNRDQSCVQLGHRALLLLREGESCKVVYAAPEGFSLLSMRWNSRA